ncbi:hypothetical protein D3C80_1000130 [compost metagenome]
MNDRHEDDWPDHHADHFDERIAERLHRHGDVRCEMSQQDADYGSSKNLEPELAKDPEPTAAGLQRRARRGRIAD